MEEYVPEIMHKAGIMNMVACVLVYQIQTITKKDM